MGPTPCFAVVGKRCAICLTPQSKGVDRFLINFTFTGIKFFSMVLFEMILYSEHAFNDNKNSTLNPLGDQSRMDASTKVHQKFCINLRLTIKNAKESNYCIKEIYLT